MEVATEDTMPGRFDSFRAPGKNEVPTRSLFDNGDPPQSLGVVGSEPLFTSGGPSHPGGMAGSKHLFTWDGPSNPRGIAGSVHLFWGTLTALGRRSEGEPSAVCFSGVKGGRKESSAERADLMMGESPEWDCWPSFVFSLNGGTGGRGGLGAAVAKKRFAKKEARRGLSSPGPFESKNM